MSADAGRSLDVSERRLARARTRLEMLVVEARRALRAGREDVARLALQRRRMSIAEIEALERRLAELHDEASRVDARADAVDRLVDASLAEVPVHSCAPRGRYRLKMEADSEVERQLRGLLDEDLGVER